jgi:aspartyl-tRNA(Asn)/glutamyl-tRNA(Gln) amidotransferase subunit A
VTVDEQLHAFLRVHDGPRGPLPVAVKDNISIAGRPLTCGSRVLAEYVAAFDATVIARLAAKGATFVGQTNLDEFAMGSSTEHSAFGVTRNPWDTSRVAGGSSGGSAAAVASRMVPLALGSDTGGSVRQPAALCGVVGVKPTYGRVSRWGLVAFGSSLDQVGTFSVTVRESAEVLGIIAGHDPLDSTSSMAPVDDYTADLGRGVEGLRVGIIAEAVEPLTGEVRENFDAAVDVLRRGGARVGNASIPSIGQSVAVYYVIANAEASANLSRFDGIRFGHRSERAKSLHDVYFESRGEGFGPEVKRRIMLGTFALSSGYYDAYYGRAQRVRARLAAEMKSSLAEFDVLLTPTTPEPAFRIGEKVEDPLSMYLSDVFTTPASLTGVPAIAVPSGFDSRGLPLSLQIMATHFAERTMFRVAEFFESVTEYWKKKPPVCALPA